MGSKKWNRQFSLAFTIFAVSGLLAILLLASFGSDWGTAYGQTAGPTPTPTRQVIGGGTPTPEPTETETETETPRPTRTAGPSPTPIIEIEDPTIAKTADPLSVNNGETVRFTITVSNPGTLPMTNVTVLDTVPDAFRIDDVTTSKGTVSTNNQTVTITLDVLNPGEVVTIVITTTVQVATNAVLNITNTAVVTVDSGGRTVTKTGVGGVTINGPAPATTPPVVPGLPNTGNGPNSSKSSVTTIEGWRVGLLLALVLLMLGSLLVMARTKSAKK